MSQAENNNHSSSAQVSSLVNKLKQGHISKGELFAQLSQINRNRILSRTPSGQNYEVKDKPIPTSQPTISGLSQETLKVKQNPNAFSNEVDQEIAKNGTLQEQSSPKLLQDGGQLPQGVSPLSSSETPNSAHLQPQEDTMETDTPDLQRSMSGLSQLSGGSGSISGFNGQGRRAIIKRLIEEKKKQAMQGQQQRSPPQQSDGHTQVPSQPHSRRYSYSSEQAPPPPPGAQGQPPAPPPGYYDGDYYQEGEAYGDPRDDTGAGILMGEFDDGNEGGGRSPHLQRSNSAGRQSPQHSAQSGRSSRRSLSAAPRMLERHINDPHKSFDEEQMLANYGYYANKENPEMSQTYNRALRSQEAIRKQLMQQCTFKPAVKELPSFYGEMKDRDVPFHDRIQRWIQEKTDSTVAQKQASAKRELEDCTFTPNINQNSLLAAAMINEAKGFQDYSVAERLYLDGENHQEIVAHKVGQLKEQMDDLEKSNCTFQPNMALTKKSAAWKQTTSRYMTDHLEQSRELSRTLAKAEMEAEETFCPQTKDPLPHMMAAKEYLKENVFSRLAKSAEPETSEELDQESVRRMASANTNMGFDTFLDSLEGSIYGNKSESSSKQGLGSQQIKEFNQRQQLFLSKKEKNQEELKIKLTPKFKPDFEAKLSLQIMQSNNKGTFLQRVERDALKKEHNAARQEGEKKIDPECTFRPEINQKSKNLQGRSVLDLSRGDMLRKETTQRLTKLRTEQQTLQGITFKPKLNDSYSNVPSKLKVSSDIGTLVGRIQQNHQRELKRRKDVLAQKEDEEAKDLTFKPKIKECPDYIKRMAEGIATAKAAQQANATNQSKKPDWR